MAIELGSIASTRRVAATSWREAVRRDLAAAAAAVQQIAVDPDANVDRRYTVRRRSVVKLIIDAERLVQRALQRATRANAGRSQPALLAQLVRTNDSAQIMARAARAGRPAIDVLTDIRQAIVELGLSH